MILEATHEKTLEYTTIETLIKHAFKTKSTWKRLKKGDSREKVSSLVPEAGIEPALPKEQDFESSASTSSATRAYVK